MRIIAEEYLSAQDWQALTEVCQQANYHIADFYFVIEDNQHKTGKEYGLPETNIDVGLKITHQPSGKSKTYPYLKMGESDSAAILAFSEDLKNQIF